MGDPSTFSSHQRDDEAACFQTKSFVAESSAGTSYSFLVFHPNALTSRLTAGIALRCDNTRTRVRLGYMYALLRQRQSFRSFRLFRPVEQNIYQTRITGRIGAANGCDCASAQDHVIAFGKGMFHSAHFTPFCFLTRRDAIFVCRCAPCGGKGGL